VPAGSGRRREIARELQAALTGGPARTEELTPLRRDPLTAIPVAAAALATLVRPSAWRHFTSGSVEAYSLTPAACRQITQAVGGDGYEEYSVHG
jgi:hypothetical protein